jgi:hypothetical protein
MDRLLISLPSQQPQSDFSIRLGTILEWATLSGDKNKTDAAILTAAERGYRTVGQSGSHAISASGQLNPSWKSNRVCSPSRVVR